jgi:hypothetical protein
MVKVPSLREKTIAWVNTEMERLYPSKGEDMSSNERFREVVRTDVQKALNGEFGGDAMSVRMVVLSAMDDHATVLIGRVGDTDVCYKMDFSTTYYNQAILRELVREASKRDAIPNDTDSFSWLRVATLKALDIEYGKGKAEILSLKSTPTEVKIEFGYVDSKFYSVMTLDLKFHYNTNILRGCIQEAQTYGKHIKVNKGFPMESAPKDRSTLGYTEVDGQRAYFVMWWSKDFDGWRGYHDIASAPLGWFELPSS